MTPKQRHAIREKHLDACRAHALQMMSFPLGQTATDGCYYTEMFSYLYGELVSGRTPTGVPARLMEEWKAVGEYRRRRKVAV